MAVQAQYPSNVLFLNRSGQEGHDYSLQSQPGGFLDQSHMLFDNGGGENPRKRGREVAAEAATSGGIQDHQILIHPFSVQTPQLIELSQLHNNPQNPHPNMVSTGLRLSFGDQQISTNHHYHQHQQQRRRQDFTCQSFAFSSLFSEDFSAQFKRQSDEIDRFLQTQEEQLKLTLAEKRQRHYHALLRAAEESVARRLREKAAEIEKATRRNADLVSRAAQLSEEAQVWEAKARAQEASAVSLQAQLQRAIMSGGAAQDKRRGDDGLTCAGVAEDAESAYVDPDAVTPSGGPSCKSCRNRAASVVVLPCRHLCLCTECDQVVGACPLCLHVRNSSVEVFLC